MTQNTRYGLRSNAVYELYVLQSISIDLSEVILTLVSISKVTKNSNHTQIIVDSDKEHTSRNGRFQFKMQLLCWLRVVVFCGVP